MRRIFWIGLSALLLGSCGVVKKKTTYGTERPTVSVAADDPPAPAAGEETPPPAPVTLTQADAIIQTAMSYTGVRYRYGGTNRRGMDCSGLLYVSFLEHDFPMPRISHDMAEEGKRIRVDQLQKGDLLFFKTTKRGRRINHVGLVVDVTDGDVRFIHSTSSRGVIVSSLREGFWNYAFVKATRVL